MQCSKGIFVGILAAVFLCAPSAWSADATLTLDANSSYVWRGINLSRDPVMQPSLDVSGLKIAKRPLSINVWSSFDLGDNAGDLKAGRFSEVDLAMTIDLSAGFKASYFEYLFPAVDVTREAPPTREVMLSWSREMAVTPTISLYYDVGEIKDFFLMVNLGREFTLDAAKKMKLRLSGEAGLTGEKFAQYYGGEGGGLYHYALQAKFSRQVSEKLNLFASAAYTGAFDEAHLPDQPRHFYGGVSCSYGF
ncbi:MAG: hypothetical protein MUF51_07870 [Vicinamibacteria bacterium]|jgi:hypothetical protein|nr:hypothetical protein [Vicinamibacteria bacterium]